MRVDATRVRLWWSESRPTARTPPGQRAPGPARPGRSSRAPHPAHQPRQSWPAAAAGPAAADSMWQGCGSSGGSQAAGFRTRRPGGNSRLSCHPRITGTRPARRRPPVRPPRWSIAVVLTTAMLHRGGSSRLARPRRARADPQRPRLPAGHRPAAMYQRGSCATGYVRAWPVCHRLRTSVARVPPATFDGAPARIRCIRCIRETTCTTRPRYPDNPGTERTRYQADPDSKTTPDPPPDPHSTATAPMPQGDRSGGEPTVRGAGCGRLLA